ncbi:genetic competence negative regulator [Pontibacillus yanchengensis]|uniref:Genetic competence negative regulator n=2 Tax=Pontibacillus yanchengensis TaxID=462910 RepID=A0ACC7VLL8_9BACI|nr:genetic competence negative regulator [Pontibacillus yanchengensis]MYL32717.1 genetic competence negative regulator [Pontibacillus yanchengensis]MYL55111.1 genetic competence negative regulator [Pontibacillus yanchengensis]
MRLERMSDNKFKIFLTFDDLMDRGLTREDLWQDLPTVHQLFHDMMYEATDELGIELEGMLQVQVYLMQAQGMLIVVTQSDDLDDEYDDDFIEMKVTLDESKEMVFAFSSFEDIIQVSKHLKQLPLTGGSVYFMDSHYYMKLDENELFEFNRESIIAIMSEFSSPSTVTSHRLIEYGKEIFKSNAVQSITQYFD